MRLRPRKAPLRRIPRIGTIKHKDLSISSKWIFFQKMMKYAKNKAREIINAREQIESNKLFGK